MGKSVHQLTSNEVLKESLPDYCPNGHELLVKQAALNLC